MSTQEIQRRAVEIVMKFERSQDRKSMDISEKLSGNGYDIASSSRKIEVKGFSGSLPSRVVLNYYNYKAYKSNKNFWLYLVYNLRSKKPKIAVLKRAEISGEEYTQFEVRLNKKSLNVVELE